MLTLGMDYERLAQILFKPALTYNTFSVKVPKNQAARYLAFEELLHFRVLRGNLPDCRHWI
jgi:hypothetical protein